MNQQQPLSRQCVILLHGLARTHFSMLSMQRALTQAGFCVVNIDYPSRQLPIEELAFIAIEQGLQQCRQQCSALHVHFVTHSLGGILVRQYLSQHTIPELGRVVMLAPPNQGTEAVDVLRHLPGFSLLNGPAGAQLGTRTQDVPKRLGKVNFELGVIAGEISFNPVLSAMIPGIDDGKVSVKNTRVEGMKDFISLPINHTFIMRFREARRQTLHFLRHGCFDHSDNSRL